MLLEVLAGPRKEDSPAWSLTLPAPSFGQNRPRVAVCAHHPAFATCKEVTAAVTATGKALEAAGAEVFVTPCTCLS